MTETIDTLDDLKEEMAQHFAEFEQDYREADWGEIVYEDADVVVLADHKGYELTEWGNDFGDYDAVSELMHELARKYSDYDWSASWPVVFEKR